MPVMRCSPRTMEKALPVNPPALDMVGNHQEEARREAGVRFLKYMMSDAVQERILLETEQVPANPSISPENYAQVSGRFADAVGVVRSSDIKIETPDNLWENTKWKFLRIIFWMCFPAK